MVAASVATRLGLVIGASTSTPGPSSGPLVGEPERGSPIAFAVPVAALFAASLMGYACWATFSGHGRFIALRVGYGPDSTVYVAAARAPMWSLKFLATPDGAPFLFPLLAKLCLRNLRAIVILQSGIATVCWIYLARTIAMRLRTPAVRSLTFAVLLLLGASPAVLLWNATIATESLSVSLLCLVIALLVRVASGARRRERVAFVVVLVLLACVRDTYAPLLLVVAVIAALVAVARRDARRYGVIVAAACAVAAVVNIGLSNHAGRWFDPLDETIAVRLLGDHTATTYFVEHGMPLDARVRALHKEGGLAYLAHSVPFGREYAPYKHWLLTRGRSTYSSFLLTHPVYDVVEPFDDRGKLLTPKVRGYGWVYHDEPRGVFTVVGSVGFPGSLVLAEIWTGLAGVCGCVLWRLRRDRALLIATGLLALLVVPYFFVVWHGDALEIDRHSLSVAVQLRIVLWVVTAMALDSVLEHGGQHGRSAHRRKRLSRSESGARARRRPGEVLTRARAARRRARPS